MKVSVVDKHQKAYANRDLDNFLNTMDDKVKVYNLKTSELMWQGKEYARKIYGNMFSQSPDLQVVKKNRMIINDTVIDHLIIRGIRGNPEEKIGIEISEVNDANLISRQWFIF